MESFYVCSMYVCMYVCDFCVILGNDVGGVHVVVSMLVACACVFAYVCGFFRACTCVFCVWLCLRLCLCWLLVFTFSLCLCFRLCFCFVRLRSCLC